MGFLSKYPYGLLHAKDCVRLYSGLTINDLILQDFFPIGPAIHKKGAHKKSTSPQGRAHRNQKNR